MKKIFTTLLDIILIPIYLILLLILLIIERLTTKKIYLENDLPVSFKPGLIKYRLRGCRKVYYFFAPPQNNYFEVYQGEKMSSKQFHKRFKNTHCYY